MTYLSLEWKTHSTFFTWEPVIKLLWEMEGFVYYLAAQVWVSESFVNFVAPKLLQQQEMDTVTFWLYLRTLGRWDHLNDFWL